MGTVYRAVQPALQRDVALKIVARDRLSEARAHERFRREALAAARVEHPHVLPIHDVGERPEGFYIAMRLVDGPNLGQLIQHSGPLPLPRALRLLQQLAGALDALHRHGIVHCDLKPRNVLVDEPGETEHAYLTDFGIAWVSGEEPAPCRGTRAYAAPEQRRGERVDARADIYALGCLLHEMLTGLPPRSARGLPGSPVDAVLRRALADDPRDRYASAGALANAALTGSS
jgi:serine/threonine protein kinase